MIKANIYTSIATLVAFSGMTDSTNAIELGPKYEPDVDEIKELYNVL